jgi:hypothetical protein
MNVLRIHTDSWECWRDFIRNGRSRRWPRYPRLAESREFKRFWRRKTAPTRRFRWESRITGRLGQRSRARKFLRFTARPRRPEQRKRKQQQWQRQSGAQSLVTRKRFGRSRSRQTGRMRTQQTGRTAEAQLSFHQGRRVQHAIGASGSQCTVGHWLFLFGCPATTVRHAPVGFDQLKNLGKKKKSTAVNSFHSI